MIRTFKNTLFSIFSILLLPLTAMASAIGAVLAPIFREALCWAAQMNAPMFTLEDMERLYTHSVCKVRSFLADVAARLTFEVGWRAI